MKKRITVLLLLFVFISAFIFPTTRPESNSVIKMKPYLQAVTANSVYVLVETDSVSPVLVEYGSTARYGMTAVTESLEKTSASPATYIHNVKLTGLEAENEYHYRVYPGLGGTPTEDSSFKTAVNPGTPFRFAWMADCRSDIDIHEAIAKRIIDANPRFSLYGGDLCYDTPYNSWKTEFFTSNELKLISRVPFFNTAGNHECWSTNTKAFTQAPESSSGTQEYYSFDYGDVHVIVLNTEVQLTKDTPQYKFVQRDLASTDKQWKIAISHRPAYASGGHEEKTKLDMKQLGTNLLEPLGLDMLISGDDHYYQHNYVNGLHYVVAAAAGGGGLNTPIDAPYTLKAAMDYNYAIIDVTPTTFNMEIINDKGVTIDTITLNKPLQSPGPTTAPSPTPEMGSSVDTPFNGNEVFLQNGLNNYSGSKDTDYIIENSGSLGYSGVGQSSYLYLKDIPDGDKYNNLIYFDLENQIPKDATIDLALLYLNTGIYPYSEAYAHIYRITDPDNLGMWREGSNTDSKTKDGAAWLRRDGTGDTVTKGWTNTPGSTVMDSVVKDKSGIIRFTRNTSRWGLSTNLKKDVQAWVSGSAVNQGWYIRSTNTGAYTEGMISNQHATQDSRPMLYVAYHLPNTPTPKPTASPEDTVAPKAPVVNPVDDNDNAVIGKTEAKATVVVKRENTTVGSAKAKSDGSFSVQIKKQKAGILLKVTAKDAAGNQSKAASITVKDKTAPPIPVVNTIKSTSGRVTGRAEAGANIQIKKEGAFIGSAYTKASGSYSVTISRQKKGTVLYVTAKDKASNTSKARKVTVK